ncbi:single-strand DNA-binding protein [Thermosporothrix hazakensis]|jgi:single-strand DNA-binding protein|uniref:Single-stranded DNA-binding protein n=1 Tax=Thermosporothrix hazakensis TaxID=644383 RepID=A0A326U0V2_THEHA|nr:single-stranded DNA-binding protein [Thermosporothrix hazakensis]PZW23312.1 single-strand DNA-binding protein [Thermosporothrix hazakensis]GCE47761.1 hypothetical protein KTH_26300 [Thermosporothrix hazakensis]
MNKIILIGNLGRDPELSYLPDGTAMVKFSLAVSKRTKSASGERETDWFNIVAWRQLAETCSRFLHKGSKVYIEGRVNIRRYTDSNNVERTAVDVTATDMEMLTPKNQQPAASNDADSFLDMSNDLGDLDAHPF